MWQVVEITKHCLLHTDEDNLHNGLVIFPINLNNLV